jgi:hypothetical protein
MRVDARRPDGKGALPGTPLTAFAAAALLAACADPGRLRPPGPPGRRPRPLLRRTAATGGHALARGALVDGFGDAR